jgi:hypothetical protein
MAVYKYLGMLAVFGLSLFVALLISTAAALTLVMGLSVMGLIFLWAGKFRWASWVLVPILAFILKLLVV